MNEMVALQEENTQLKKQNEIMIDALLGFLHDMDIYGAPKQKTVREGYSALDFVKGDSDE